MSTRPRRLTAPEVNASPMADIAFLLLIFFLVTTEVAGERGIFVRLPAYDPDPPSTTISGRNTFTVLVNGVDAPLVEGEPATLAGLRQRVRAFVANPTDDPELASCPRKAVVSLRNDRATTYGYGAYLAVYAELQGAYRDLRDAAVRERYGLGYASEHLGDAERVAVRGEFPMVISEAEPTDWFGGGGGGDED